VNRRVGDVLSYPDRFDFVSRSRDPSFTCLLEVCFFLLSLTLQELLEFFHFESWVKGAEGVVTGEEGVEPTNVSVHIVGGLVDGAEGIGGHFFDFVKNFKQFQINFNSLKRQKTSLNYNSRTRIIFQTF
jgi:hypothetical protein